MYTIYTWVMQHDWRFVLRCRTTWFSMQGSFLYDTLDLFLDTAQAEEHISLSYPKLFRLPFRKTKHSTSALCKWGSWGFAFAGSSSNGGFLVVNFISLWLFFYRLEITFYFIFPSSTTVMYHSFKMFRAKAKLCPTLVCLSVSRLSSVEKEK